MINQEVLFEEMPGKEGNLGIITLNRPQVLNSLNLSMIHAMHDQLKKWAMSDSIKAVVIKAAEGRAFCAGGDLRLTYENFKTDKKTAATFFKDEYLLNRFIFHFPKPYIALLDGITMGGGVGISIHGSHRIATDRLIFAMPETGIGFFPDVGGSYFLPRLEGRFGFYLGLSGARVNADDCVILGIAQHKVHQTVLNELLVQLAQKPYGDDSYHSVTEIIDLFSTPVQTNASSLFAHQDEIDKCFSFYTVEAILDALMLSKHPFSQETAAAIMKKSPLSLKVTLMALEQGQQLDFDACMRQEYRIARHFILGHDFSEGIRALIIDKDQTPHWQPPTLAEISLQEVQNYFAPLTEELA